MVASCTFGVDCLADETLPVAGDDTGSAASALTYVGMDDIAGVGVDYVVRLENTDANTLRFSEFHVQGDDDTLLITDNARYENNDPPNSLPAIWCGDRRC